MDEVKPRPVSTRATIKDVARAAGVSAMTVSNVLNGRTQFVSAATRKRVEREIARLNYRRQANARNLRVAEQRSVGMVIVDESPFFLADYFTCQVVAGLANVLNRADYTLTLQGMRIDQLASSMIMRSFEVGGLCAMISGPRAERLRIVETLTRLQQPLVLFQEALEKPFADVCVIRQDDHAGGRLLADHLLARRVRTFLAIVPLLALVAFLAPGGGETSLAERLREVAIGLGAIVGLVVAGRCLPNPLCRILAVARAREVMTAAALLVVLGSALAMQLSGLSMAMGAFLAGVLLSESTFRHQLEADIEPFRGVLLGLFFLAVGMSLDLGVVAANWRLIAVYVVAYMVMKGIGIYLVARFLRTGHREALERAVLMAQGGEFAFVLYSSAAAVGIIDGGANAVLTAIIIISMVLTPLAIAALRRLTPRAEQSLEGVDVAEGLSGSVLIVGFGRFGQIVSQPLLLRGVDVAIIDNDVEMIQAAANFGFKVYYGDGTRLDILHAAGAANARAVLICVDKPEAAVRIAELVKAEFPLTLVFARAFDRGTSIQLVHANVDYQIRETFESALVFGGSALEALGVDPQEVAEVVEDVRQRDTARFELQLAGNIQDGRLYFKGNMSTPVPAPVAQPRRTGQALSEETADVIGKQPAQD